MSLRESKGLNEPEETEPEPGVGRLNISWTPRPVPTLTRSVQTLAALLGETDTRIENSHETAKHTERQSSFVKAARGWRPHTTRAQADRKAKRSGPCATL